MGHLLFSVAEFVLLLGGIGVFLTVLLCLGLGLAAKAIAQMFSGKPAQKHRVKNTPAEKKTPAEVELLRQQLFEARNTAYESALASEKTIKQLQQRLHALEAERTPGFVSARP